MAPGPCWVRSCSVFGSSTWILPIRIKITKADPVHLSHPCTALDPSNLSHPPQCLVDLNPVSISSLPSVSSIPSLSSLLSIHTLHLIPPISHPFHPCRFTAAVSSIWGSYVSYGPCPSSIRCFSSLSSLLSSSISSLLMSPNAQVVHPIYLIYLHPQDLRPEDTASQTRWTRQHGRQVGRKTGDKLGDEPNGHGVPDELEKLYVHLDAFRSAFPVECSCHPRVFMHRFFLAILCFHSVFGA